MSFQGKQNKKKNEENILNYFMVFYGKRLVRQ